MPTNHALAKLSEGNLVSEKVGQYAEELQNRWLKKCSLPCMSITKFLEWLSTVEAFEFVAGNNPLPQGRQFGCV
jgi:hypothetical protein